MVDSMVKLDGSETLSMSIWHSTYFKANNRFLDPRVRRFTETSRILATPMDILGPNGKLLDQESINRKFGIAVPQEILQAVSTRIDRIRTIPLPRIPLGTEQPVAIPFNYACLTRYKKGCSYWNRYLKRKKTVNIRMLEDKNAASLGLQIDQDRWKQIYWLVSNIRYGNDIRWFQHQILRGCLTTNYVLKKMLIRDCDMCTFCGLETEKLEHLFWTCRNVSQFLLEIKDELDRIWPGYDLGFTPNNLYGKEVFLLGDNRPRSGMAPNYMYSLVKKFIWNTRCREAVLSTGNFWNFLDLRLRNDRTLADKLPDLIFIVELAIRRGLR